MRVSSKGQVTIPKPLRDHIGIGAGGDVEFSLDGDVITRTAALKQHMAVARCYENLAGQNRVAVLGLANIDPAQTVEASREGGREKLRHVLDDDNAGTIRRQLDQDLAQ